VRTRARRRARLADPGNYGTKLPGLLDNEGGKVSIDEAYENKRITLTAGLEIPFSTAQVNPVWS
jgi:hypothetical protein